MGDHVIVNISGQRFCISRQALRRFPHTRLSQLFLRDTSSTGATFSPKPPSDDRSGSKPKLKSRHEYFFDRSPVIFAGVMDLYRSGSVHVPPNACSQMVQSELEFWQVDLNKICRYCQLQLADQVNHQKELHEMQHAFGDDTRHVTSDMLFTFSSSNRTPSLENLKQSESLTIIQQLTNFFQEPSSARTRWTRAYRIVFSAAVFLYVFAYILESEETFRVKTNSCHDKYGHQNKSAWNQTNLTANLTMDHLKESSQDEGEPFRTHRRFKKYFTSAPAPGMLAVDIICLFFFTFDLGLRFALAPTPRINFLRLSTTIADIAMTLANSLATFLVWLPKENFNCDHGILITYLTLEILRVARLARLLQFTNRYNGIRVLLLSLSSSIRELLLLMSGLLTAVVIFGLTIYVSEIGEVESNYDNYTAAFWWAMVSMTTVGYGDYTPKSIYGMIVSALCAISGLLYSALQMPVIANRFNALYLYAREKERRVERTDL